MKLNSLAVAGLLALGSVTAAHADDDLGTLTSVISSSGALSFSAGLINDDYTFTLTADSWVQSNVHLIAGSAAVLPAIYGIYDAATDMPVFPTSYNFSTANVTHTDTLAAGSYYFKVFGLATGANAYAISASATAVPVPEPETYAMLAAGLGVIGFLSSRRRNR